ncbi:MAG: acetate--CoA ligase family protein [Candidatus Doudnabacteria bacterium]|nr:acetate--CoA ligase family protein [Candidatus Doudnabacteria bacterium]
MPSLTKLFSPSSIAVVGVSAETHKLGSVIMQNILSAGFAGPVYPVNPKYEVAMGVKCYPKVSKIRGDIDLVVIAVPAEFVPDVMRDCAKKRVEYVVIVSAGFRELGLKGLKLELEVRHIAEKFGIRVLGPNCLGLSVSATKLDATFAAMQPLGGNIAFLSQSGAFNSAILDMAAARNVGFSHFVSMGNKVDLNELDFVAEWLKDDNVKVIGMYLEQFSDGKDLLDLIKAHPYKPVVILHPGETVEAQKAMNLHTGALAGSSAIVRAALAQAGVIQVDSLEKLFHSMWLLSLGRDVHQGRVAIITNAGGPGVMLTDMIARHGLSLAELTVETLDNLKRVLPPSITPHNPVDLVGDALAERYDNALKVVAQDQNVDAILVVLTPQLVTQIEETARVVAQHFRNSKKLIIPLFIGGVFVEAAITKFNAEEIPSFIFPEQAVNALAAVARFHLPKQTKKTINLHSRTFTSIAKHTHAVARFTRTTPVALPQALTFELAKEVELDLPKQTIVDSFDSALSFVSETHFPVVLKALAEDITHKTDVKALYTDVRSVAELHEAFFALEGQLQRVSKKSKPAVLIQEQIRAQEEVLIGVNRSGDSRVYEQDGLGFGHALVFGKGGIYTEVWGDVAMGLVPMTKEQLLEMIHRTKLSKVLHGARGKKPLAVDKIVDTLLKIQKLVQMYPQISSLDINPAMVTSSRCVAVDLKIFVQE